MRHLIVALGVAAVVGGCAPMVWDKPGETQAQFNQDNARCRLVARGMNPGFYASGSVGYVAGAEIGNAIGTAIMTRENYKDCMAATGYTQESPQTVAAATAMKPAFEALPACMRAIYVSPAAAPIAAHAPFRADAATPAQLADPQFATSAEIAALNVIVPQRERCQRSALAALSTVEPAAVPILSATMAGTASREMLENRQITWGQYNTRARDGAAETQAQIVAALGGASQ